MKISPDMPLDELLQLMDKTATISDAEALRNYLVTVGWEATESIPSGLWTCFLSVVDILGGQIP